MNQRGQITIFIILAMVIAGGIIAVLLFTGKISVQQGETLNPGAFIDKCVKDAVKPSIEKVLFNGGRIEPDLFLMYKSEKYNYLCYQKNYYWTCINHYPQLKKIIEGEITRDSEEKVKKCFVTLKANMEKRGFSISEGAFSWKVEMLPKRVEISIQKRIDSSQEDIKQSFDKFDVKILSPLYELTMIAREIVNQEAQFCNFEYNGFMLLYPEYDIKRIDYDENKIYRLKDRLTNEEFKFAVRSCSSPPGL